MPYHCRLPVLPYAKANDLAEAKTCNVLTVESNHHLCCVPLLTELLRNPICALLSIYCRKCFGTNNTMHVIFLYNVVI